MIYQGEKIRAARKPVVYLRHLRLLASIGLLLLLAGPVLAQTVWTKFENNPVLDIEAPGAFDDGHVWHHSLLFEEGVYKMWFTGAPVNRSAGHIGFATSADGTNWTKDPVNPVLSPGAVGEWDEPIILNPVVIRDGDTLKMWYGGNNFNKGRVGYATSKDGINWAKHPSNPVMDAGPAGAWDELGGVPQSVIFDGNIYHMWYFGPDAGFIFRIGYATSPDGITWTKYDDPSTTDPPFAESDPVLKPGPTGSWDAKSVANHWVLFDGLKFHMWYEAFDQNSTVRVGYATSADGITWTKYDDPSTTNTLFTQSDPVLLPGQPGSWDATVASQPKVLFDGTTFHMWYIGRSGTNFRIGYATAPDMSTSGYTQTFTRIDTGAIAVSGGFSQGSAWGDFDNDGDLDLVINNGSPVSRTNNRIFLFQNDLDGGFKRLTSGAVATDLGAFGNGTWGDYDNDGDLDLFVGAIPEDNRLFRNEGEGTFLRITTGSVVQDGGFSVSSGWVDFDNDGHLDLYVTNDGMEKNFLYRNVAGLFTKITEGAIVNDFASSLGASWVDVDNDGDMDCYVANLDQNHFYSNNGDGTFAKVTNGHFVTNAFRSSGSSWGDFNNDGFIDLYVGITDGADLLYENNGDGTFKRVTTGPIVSDPTAQTAGTWGDFDNDGDLDLFVANRVGENRFFRNDGAQFTEIEAGDITTDGGWSTTNADFDNDGDLDIIVTNGIRGEPFENYLYRNEGNSNHWINIRLVGETSNRTAIGARVLARATINGEVVWQTRQVAQMTGRIGHNSLRVHFGLGDAVVVDSLVVHWPSRMGTVDRFADVPVDTFLKVTEGKNVTSFRDGVAGQPGGFQLAQNYPNPFNPATTIRFDIPERLTEEARVQLRIYNLLGELVRTLVDEQKFSGQYTVEWDGKNHRFEPVASGIYIYRLTAGEFKQTRRMLLLK